MFYYKEKRKKEKQCIVDVGRCKGFIGKKKQNRSEKGRERNVDRGEGGMQGGRGGRGGNGRAR